MLLVRISTVVHFLGLVEGCCSRVIGTRIVAVVVAVVTAFQIMDMSCSCYY